MKVVIPARLESTRLPGKVLMRLYDKPMIQWVYERAVKADVGEVIIATDSHAVREAALKFGARVELTGFALNGTDRCWRLAQTIGLKEDEIILNVQGDQPLVDPEHIRMLAAAKGRVSKARIVTGIAQGVTTRNVDDPSVVKAVIAKNRFDEMRCIGFYRKPVNTQWRHVGLYMYLVGSLKAYVEDAPNSAHLTEEITKLEQLRWYAVRHQIAAVDLGAVPAPEVNTIGDFERVMRIVENEMTKDLPNV